MGQNYIEGLISGEVAAVMYCVWAYIIYGEPCNWGFDEIF